MYVQYFTASKQKWIPDTIQRATHPVSYIVMLSDGSTVIRHFDNIKARHTKNTRKNVSCTLPSNHYQVKHTVHTTSSYNWWHVVLFKDVIPLKINTISMFLALKQYHTGVLHGCSIDWGQHEIQGNCKSHIFCSQ